MEEAALILEFLPTSFKHQNEESYVKFLWDAFVSNYEAEQYQFALLPYHMLFMCSVYCALWQIRDNRKELITNVLLLHKDEDKILKASSPFGFSVIHESGIFDFMKLVGCDQQYLGKFKALVKTRNDIAHPDGNIHFQSKKSIDIQIAEVLRQAAVIQRYMQPVLHSCLGHFLLESYDPEDREYSLDEDQIREGLVHTNYFSNQDVASCLQFNIESLREQEHFTAAHALFESFRVAYTEE